MQQQKCDRCQAIVDIDAGSFECAEVSQETGKCIKYVFVCDECTDKETEATIV